MGAGDQALAARLLKLLRPPIVTTTASRSRKEADMPDQTVIVVRAKGVLDVDLGEVLEGASVVIEGNRITSVTDVPPSASDVDQVIDLPELTLVPGLMDMEVDLVLGGP